MKTITVMRIDLQFDADEVTHGTSEQQAHQAVDQINIVLQREPLGLCAQLFINPKEIELKTEQHTP